MGEDILKVPLAFHVLASIEARMKTRLEDAQGIRRLGEDIVRFYQSLPLSKRSDESSDEDFELRLRAVSFAILFDQQYGAQQGMADLMKEVWDAEDGVEKPIRRWSQICLVAGVNALLWSKFSKETISDIEVQVGDCEDPNIILSLLIDKIEELLFEDFLARDSSVDASGRWNGYPEDYIPLLCYVNAYNPESFEIILDRKVSASLRSSLEKMFSEEGFRRIPV